MRGWGRGAGLVAGDKAPFWGVGVVGLWGLGEGGGLGCGQQKKLCGVWVFMVADDEVPLGFAGCGAGEGA